LTIQIFGRITTSNYLMLLLRVSTPVGHIQFGRRQGLD